MSEYQALYRKYRPRTFDEVAGQEHITQTLKNQISSGRQSHAYLFVGTRGTGKTSCAKILARAVNCENPHDGNPCNECEPCRSIENGSATDIMEIDAASNNGVDNVRALRDEAIFSPAVTRKRVYIIDEVHMLSNSAFNALLKILEEPPEHLVFILATTELHKVPATIVSRCQRFAFRRLSREVIAAQLVSVAASENIALDGDAAATLARLGDGSMRDALSLLDQCSDGGAIDGERVREVVGLPSRDAAIALASAIAERDAARVFTLFDASYRGGAGAATLFEELAVLARDALILSLIPSGGELLSGSADTNSLKALAETFGRARLLAFADLLAKARGAFTRGTGDRTTAELALIAALSDAEPTATQPVTPPAASPVPQSERSAAKRVREEEEERRSEVNAGQRSAQQSEVRDDDAPWAHLLGNDSEPQEPTSVIDRLSQYDFTKIEE
ncbi:MAG: DNA polymerase III subunit gamma/tau [Oscillospiraceae bacterium]|jgi:DNA polymerase-3 subunit gamma/tau|nr:DNA polymerase III subunit gamma/tau [Oscillospiraceae bacterium]